MPNDSFPLSEGSVSKRPSRAPIYSVWRLINILILTIALFAPWLSGCSGTYSGAVITLVALDSLRYITPAMTISAVPLIGIGLLCLWGYLILNGIELLSGCRAHTMVRAFLLGAASSAVLLLPWLGDTLEWGYGLTIGGLASSVWVELADHAIKDQSDPARRGKEVAATDEDAFLPRIEVPHAK